MSLVSKSRRIPPLETIYEESGSYVSSVLSNHHLPSPTINGLISARSIPTVDVHRQRVSPSTGKPPIEVRFRDGSKRFIHSSSLLLNNGRSLFRSSPNPFADNGLAAPAKAPLVFTIITADDLERAGVPPSICSSPDDFDRSYLSYSRSTSSVETFKNLSDVSTIHLHSPTLTLPSDSFASSITPIQMQSSDTSVSSQSLSEISRTGNHDAPLTNGYHTAFRPIPRPLPTNGASQRLKPPLSNQKSQPIAKKPEGSSPTSQWYSIPSTSAHRRSFFSHESSLETRLLNAGLSPETVALYERILRVADHSAHCGLSSLNAFNAYPIRL